jgi:hypothetical protein
MCILLYLNYQSIKRKKIETETKSKDRNWADRDIRHPVTGAPPPKEE